MPDNIPEPNNRVPRRGRIVRDINGNLQRVVIDENMWAGLAENQDNPAPEINFEEQREIVNRIRNRRVNNVGQVLDTVGLELESIALSRNKVAQILEKIIDRLGNNFKVHRDGSSEMNAFYVSLNGGREQIIVNSHTKEAQELFSGKFTCETVGYELISVPMDISTAEMSLHALLPILELNGDFTSERCATHVHVGGMKKLSFVKNALRLGLWFDEVFFSLAHLDSEKFRGYSNNAIYARPIINGPYFGYNRNYYQVLNWEKALNAQNFYEFYACYGVDVDRELPKYHPGRYFSINLYSIPRIGTLEFRHFNQSFNPNMVSAVTKLCQMFVEIAMKADSKEIKHLEPGDVFTFQSGSYYKQKLYKFLDLAERFDCNYSLEKEDVWWLEKIISTYKGIGIENKEVLTHCRDFNIDSEYIELGGMKKAKNKPCPDGHVDIHNIKYQSIIK